LPLYLDGVPDFHPALYEEMLKLGWGETVTYGELAERVGAPGAAQSVGTAMGRNPVPVIVPCHRVLASGNKLGGFSAPGGGRTKLRLLEMEGVHLGFTDPRQMAFAF
jgi:methylated-DNA-[protein]-cysteine S-methyltransferase